MKNYEKLLIFKLLALSMAYHAFGLENTKFLARCMNASLLCL